MTSPPPTTRARGIIVTLALAGIVASVMQTLVVPLLTELPRILGTSSSNASWVVTATLLTGAVFGPVGGRLGDMYGKRRMLLACCAPLIIGSVVCALSSSVVPMIAGRGLQGIGMGVVPLGISLLRDVMPVAKLGSAIALISASLGIGGGLGLPIAAGVAQYASWRALFWGAAALALVVTAMIWFLVPETPAGAEGQRFDFVGAVGLGGGLVCLLVAVSKGADWGWGSGTTLGLFTASAVLLLSWGYWELRTRDPLVDLRTAAQPRILPPWITDCPTPPQPMTATVDPGSTPAVCRAAPRPVVTPQPRRASCSSGRSVRTVTTDASSTTMASANEPQPHAAIAFRPSARSKRGT